MYPLYHLPRAKHTVKPPLGVAIAKIPRSRVLGLVAPIKPSIDVCWYGKLRLAVGVFGTIAGNAWRQGSTPLADDQWLLLGIIAVLARPLVKHLTVVS